MNNTPSTAGTFRKAILISIASMPLVVGGIFAAPFIIMVVTYAIVMNIPESKVATYEGMTVDVSQGKCNRLYMERPFPRSLYVRINGRTVFISDITTGDLEDAGFERRSHIVNGYMIGSHTANSIAQFDSDGRLMRLDLGLLPSASLPFSSSPDGPFLNLILPFDEFEAQFGEPDSWEYIYPRFTAP